MQASFMLIFGNLLNIPKILAFPDLYFFSDSNKNGIVKVTQTRYLLYHYFHSVLAEKT